MCEEGLSHHLVTCDLVGAEATACSATRLDLACPVQARAAGAVTQDTQDGPRSLRLLCQGRSQVSEQASS